MNIKEALKHVSAGRDLSSKEMRSVMEEILSGHATSVQIAGFLMALRTKGETVDEITAAAKALYDHAEACFISPHPLVDIAGTGGDGANTFNISTTVAFVVAASGGYVAKHGNRSFASQSGSGDVLECAGVSLELTPMQMMECVEKVGIGFLFAPVFHGAMRFSAVARKELGVRTLFNLLGPLTNPAKATHQLVGVYDKKWVEPLAEVFKNLGSQHSLVVHSEDGLDEISIAAPTYVAELFQGKIKTYYITPQEYGFKEQSLKSCVVKSPQESYEIMLKVFHNEPGAPLDIVLFNAGATLYVADRVPSIKEGIETARAAIASKKPLEIFEALKKLTHSF